MCCAHLPPFSLLLLLRVPFCCAPCSGSDVAVVAKEAAMRPLRRLMSKLELDAPPEAQPAKLEVRVGVMLWLQTQHMVVTV